MTAMRKKEFYIAPASHVVRLAVNGNITEQFPVNSQHTISEGDAKGGYFDDEDEEETNPNPWDEPLF